MKIKLPLGGLFRSAGNSKRMKISDNEIVPDYFQNTVDIIPVYEPPAILENKQLDVQLFSGEPATEPPWPGP